MLSKGLFDGCSLEEHEIDHVWKIRISLDQLEHQLNLIGCETIQIIDDYHDWSSERGQIVRKIGLNLIQIPIYGLGAFREQSGNLVCESCNPFERGRHY